MKAKIVILGDIITLILLNVFTTSAFIVVGKTNDR
jgi:hypothetical protein